MSVSDQQLLDAGKRIGATEVWIAEDRVTFFGVACRVTFCRAFFRGDFYTEVWETLMRVV